MLDLGPSINIMPYSVYLRLGLGKLKLTPIATQIDQASERHFGRFTGPCGKI